MGVSQRMGCFRYKDGSIRKLYQEYGTGRSSDDQSDHRRSAGQSTRYRLRRRQLRPVLPEPVLRWARLRPRSQHLGCQCPPVGDHLGCRPVRRDLDRLLVARSWPEVARGAKARSLRPQPVLRRLRCRADKFRNIRILCDNLRRCRSTSWESGLNSGRGSPSRAKGCVACGSQATARRGWLAWQAGFRYSRRCRNDCRTFVATQHAEGTTHATAGIDRHMEFAPFVSRLHAVFRFQPSTRPVDLQADQPPVRDAAGDRGELGDAWSVALVDRQHRQRTDFLAAVCQKSDVLVCL